MRQWPYQIKIPRKRRQGILYPQEAVARRGDEVREQGDTYNSSTYVAIRKSSIGMYSTDIVAVVLAFSRRQI